MRVLDAGHYYALSCLDSPLNLEEKLRFVKREGPGYPGNVGRYAGTNIQEVLRVLIDRVKYLDSQIHDGNNDGVLLSLRDALWWLEARAARRHGRKEPEYSQSIELAPACSRCGHIECQESCAPPAKGA
jgi:hypothetical protein